MSWVSTLSTGRPASGNTSYQRLALLRTFYRWAVSNGHATVDPTASLTGPDNPLRLKARRTYGKQEAKNPGRWLSRTDAFDALVGACRLAGGMRGLRDELLIRLGLLGLRLNELHLLTVGSYDRAAAVLRFVGKSHKPAEVHLSPTAIRLLDQWLSAYASATPLSDDLPLLCPTRPRLPDAVQWGVALGRQSIYNTVRLRAAEAGLGHVAPHDLRRTAAGILHHDISADGGHRFDLHDIQKVLRHTDPVVTQKCYIDPTDTGALTRAAAALD